MIFQKEFQLSKVSLLCGRDMRAWNLMFETDMVLF